MIMDLQKILDRYNNLCEDNDWQVYHTPKNLASAITVSAAKILQHFQWVTEEDSLSMRLLPERKAEVADEIAETFFYLMNLSNKMGINLEEAILAKATANEEEHKGIPDEIIERGVVSEGP